MMIHIGPCCKKWLLEGEAEGLLILNILSLTHLLGVFFVYKKRGENEGAFSSDGATSFLLSFSSFSWHIE